MPELKDGDLALVRPLSLTGTQPALAQYRNLCEAFNWCGCDEDEKCTTYWAYFGTDFTHRADEVEVVERVQVFYERTLHTPKGPSTQLAPVRFAAAPDDA